MFRLCAQLPTRRDSPLQHCRADDQISLEHATCYYFLFKYHWLESLGEMALPVGGQPPLFVCVLDYFSYKQLCQIAKIWHAHNWATCQLLLFHEREMLELANGKSIDAEQSSERVNHHGRSSSSLFPYTNTIVAPRL